MINPKYICISAVVGFVLSFAIGLISGVAFLHLIIRALIFAAVFAALAIGISYLNSNFLSSELNSDPLKNDIETPSEKQSSGNLVNIVVDDSTLRDDSSAPKFSVTNPNVFGDDVLNESNSETKIEKSNPAAEKIPNEPPAEKKAVPNAHQTKNVVPEKEEPKKEPEIKNDSSKNNGFVAKNLENITSKSANKEQPKVAPVKTDANKEESSNVENEAAGAESTDDADSIDDLPDIGSIDLSDSPSEDSSIIEDSDFASEGTPSSSLAAESSNVASAGGQDVNTMAQAIRTLLAKDNE